MPSMSAGTRESLTGRPRFGRVQPDALPRDTTTGSTSDTGERRFGASYSSPATWAADRRSMRIDSKRERHLQALRETTGRVIEHRRNRRPLRRRSIRSRQIRPAREESPLLVADDLCYK
jgi:hypothetical protein